MVVISCPFNGCTYQTPDESGDIVCTLLKIHAMEHERQQHVPQQSAAVNMPKLNRPMVDVGIDEEAWIMFTRRWDTFKIGSHIGNDIAPIQLFQCASEQLGDLMLKSDPKLMLRSTEEVLAMMQSIAVIKVAVGVRRAELTKLSQDRDEAFRTFATRVQGKAETCKFFTMSKCSVCDVTTRADYTEEAIKDVMLAGISDADIRRETLSTEGILERTTNEIISFVEGKEMGRNATDESASVSAISSFRRLKKSNVDRPDQNKMKQVACPSCSKLYCPFRKMKNGWNSKPFKHCQNCWRDKKDGSAVQALSTKEADASEVLQQDTQISSLTASDSIVLESMILSKSELRKCQVAHHPKANFVLTMNGKNRSVNVEGIADTGAQSNLWGWNGFKSAGFGQEDLRPVKVRIRAANQHPINILGAFEATFSGVSPDGKTIEIRIQ